MILSDIQYFKHFSLNNNNLILVLSNLSQLKTINLPFSNSILLGNKFLIKHLSLSKYAEISFKDYNLKMCIVDNDEYSAIKNGSFLLDKFNSLCDEEVSFIFSDTLLKKNELLCSNLIFGFLLRSYSFNKYITNKKFNFFKKINIFFKQGKKFKEINRLLNLLYSINFCKDLVSEPANILNPASYALRCSSLKIKGLKVKIMNLKDIQKIGMGALESVSIGSSNEPKLVVFEWNIKKKIKPSILVGKGVTFDTGGISIKASQGMEEMITDMAGSAVVVGSMINAALNNYNKPLIGIIGLVENMPDGKSQRPGDIIKSMSGQSIEVLNTDAEGRLVLADLITYAQKNYIPKEIIDFATLTGAIMIALGTHKAGLFTNNNNLSKKLIKAGKNTNEKVWRMPLGDEYDKEINSPRADMKNIGSSRFGGSTHAAQFIQRFVNKKIPWAHLDIAGVSWSMKGGQNSFSDLHTPGATAFGIRLIDNFLRGK